MVTAAVLPAVQPQDDPDFDPTIYPTHDDMGSDSLELWLRIVLVPLVQSWLRSQNREVFVGGDQFVYYEKFNSKKCVAPDVYTHPTLRPGERVASIKTWRVGPPSFVMEIVSTNKGKDYVLSPKRYDEVGVRELILYDPDWRDRRPMGYLWQVFRRNAAGDLVQVDATSADQVGSEELGCMLREVEIDGMQRVRLFDFHNRIIPTPEELREARGLREGKAEGKEEGKAEGLRVAVRVACELLGVRPTEKQAAALEVLDAANLEVLLAHLKEHRRWPSDEP